MDNDKATCLAMLLGGVAVLLGGIAFWGFIIWAVTQALRSLGVQF